MESYWTDFAGRRNRLLASIYLWRDAEKRRLRGRAQFDNYFKFGFVRNPWDRVVSLYVRQEAAQLRSELSFAEFVRWIEYSSSTCPHSSPHRYQLDWFVDGSGTMLADFIGRFERLEQDWAFVAGKLGVARELPHARANPRARHYTEYYDEETRRLVGEKFKVDIDYFGYRFGD